MKDSIKGLISLISILGGFLLIEALMIGLLD